MRGSELARSGQLRASSHESLGTSKESALSHFTPSTTPDNFADWTVSALVNEQECQLWRFAELEAAMPDDACGQTCIEHSMAIIADDLTAIDAELTKRRRLYSSPHAPKIKKPHRVDIFRVVREQVPLEKFCHRYGPVLRGTGKTITGRCPLPDHDDKTPSFHVYPQQNTWHCFGCNRGGDIFDLARYYYQEIGVVEVARKVARDFGIMLDHSHDEHERPGYTIKRPDGSTARLKLRPRK